MDRKGKEMLTIAVIAATVILIGAFIATVVLFKTGEIDRDTFLIVSFFLSTTLTTMVIIYGVVVTSKGSAKDRYLDYLKDKDKDDGAAERDPESEGSDESDKIE